MTTATVELELEGLVEALAAADDALERNLPLAVEAAADWTAADAKQVHAYRDRSGVLTASIQSAGVSGSWRAGTLEGVVSAGAPYASFVEFGTRPHEIKAKVRKKLRIPVEGGYRFRKKVKHPGTPEFRFLRDALDRQTDDFREEVEAVAALALRRAGL